MFPVTDHIKALREADLGSPQIKAFLTKAPYVIVGALLLCLLLFANKMWATNDDAGLAMVAEGYGIAAAPSPGLVYSSVAWGWLISHLPRFTFIEPYLAMTYALLIASSCVIGLSLFRLRAPASLAAAALLTMYTNEILHPQFTIVAGYLAVAGFVVLFAWKDSRSRGHLFAAGSLLLLAGLVRLGELLLITLICLPPLVALYLDGRDQLQRRLWLALAAVVALLLGLSLLLDHAYYSSDAWTAFWGMQDIRVAFTDYHLRVYFTEHPEALKSATVTLNDVSMLGRWFESDPQVFNRDNFAPVMASAPLIGRMTTNLAFWKQPLEVLTGMQFMLLGCMALLPLSLGRGKRIAIVLSALLLAACMTGLFLLGRGGIARVYIPAIAGVLVLCMAQMPSEGKRLKLIYIAGLAILGIGAASLFQDWNTSLIEKKGQLAHNLIIERFCALPQHDLLIIWGGMYFQYKTLYDQSTGAAQGCNLHLYSISSLQLAPYSTENLYKATGYRNIIDALLNGRTLYMYTQSPELDLLQVYLMEHYGSTLSYTEVAHAYQELHVFAVQATPATLPPHATSEKPFDGVAQQDSYPN